MKKSLVAPLAGAVLLSLASAAHADWAFTDIGNMVGGASAATAINNLGTVVGSASGSTFSPGMYPYNGFVYSNGSATQIGSFNGQSTAISGINDLGVVVGTASSPGNTGIYQGFSYANGSFTGLPVQGAMTWASGISNSGQIAMGSSSEFAAGTNTAYLYSNGVLTNIGSLGGGNTSIRAMNNVGQATGSSFDSSHSTQAYIYSGSTMTSIGKLSGFDATIPTDINNLGTVVGYSFLNVNNTTIWAPSQYSNGQWTRLLPSLNNGLVLAVNDSGAIVGENNNNGFLYSNGSYLDLLSIPEVAAAGFVNIHPRDINNLGQIVGDGQIRVGNSFVSHAFLLSPTLPGTGTIGGSVGGGVGSVPEPETYGLMMASLGVLGWLGRRRKRPAAQA